MGCECRKSQTPFLDLPTEVLIEIAKSSRSIRSINRLSRTNHYLHNLLTPILYWWSAKSYRYRRRRRSALLWAAENGKTETAQLALVPYRNNLTPKKPLLAAANYGHETIVNMLLALPGVDLEYYDNDGRTALALAILNRHEGIALRLLEAGANPDPRKKMPPHFPAMEPITWDAVVGGLTQTAQILLATGRHELDWEDFQFWPDTPLIAVCSKGYYDMAKLILDAGANVNGRSHHGKTALVAAAKSGHAQVVELLLSRGADVNLREYHMSDLPRNSPLMWAAENNDMVIFNLLMAVDGIDVNVQTWHGKTALSYCAANGNFEGAKLLLQDKNLRFYYGWPLCDAITAQNEDMVRFLIGTRRLDRFVVDDAINTAVCSNDNDVALVALRLLLDNADSHGYMYKACDAGNDAAVRVLLEYPHIDAESASVACRAPLYHAVVKGYTSIVQQLLESKQVDPNREFRGRDGGGPGCTALHAAVCGGHLDMVKLFLKEMEVNPNIVDARGRTILSVAITDHESTADMVRAILAFPQFNPNIKDQNLGWTPLMCAIKKESLHAVGLILADPRTDPNIVDRAGMSALIHAIYFPRVLRILLTHPKLDVNFINRRGKSALDYTIAKGDVENFDILTRVERIGICQMNEEGKNLRDRLLQTKQFEMIEVLANRLEGGRKVWKIRNTIDIHRYRQAMGMNVNELDG